MVAVLPAVATWEPGKALEVDAAVVMMAQAVAVVGTVVVAAVVGLPVAVVALAARAGEVADEVRVAAVEGKRQSLAAVMVQEC